MKNLFAQKLSAAVNEMHDAGIRRFTHSPPIFRLLWKLGIRIRPPYYYSGFANLLILGAGFGLVFLAMRFATIGLDVDGSLGQVFTESAIAGLMFGFAMSWYYSFGARKYKLSSWESLPGQE